MFVAPMLKMGRNARKAIAASGATLAASQSEDADAGLTGFFSQAVKAAKNLTRKTGNAQGFKNDLTGKGQVKPDELKAMGFDEHFGNRSDITKEEVQEFINKNQINIKEVRLGATKGAVDRYTFEQNLDGDYDVYDPYGEFAGEVFSNREDAEIFTAAKNDELGLVDVDTSKFGKWTLDEGESGENYRELLMTLPNDDVVEQVHKLRTEYSDLLRRNDDVSVARKAEIKKELAPLELQYEGFVQEGHYSEPNILTHLRLKDRVDVDGNKTLLIEEAQSDWHQTGKDDGYRGEPIRYGDKIEGYTPVGYEWQKTVKDQAVIYQLVNSKTKEIVGEGLLKEEALQKSGLTNTVLDAPFKSDDKSSWYNLAMKRGLIEAAEGDYDKLAITTGRQQAERYDLSKTIGSLKYQEDMVEGRPVNILTAYDKHGMRVFNRRVDDPEKELPSIIGKDATKSLLEAEPYTPPQETRSIRSLRGQELNVGGEGMKEFYDRKLPNTLNKLVKQDGVKVGQTELAHPSSGTELNRDGFTRQEVAEIERLQDLVDRDYASSIDREYLANYLAREKPYGDTVHSIDITPEMRERVKKGLPLFSHPAVGAVTLAGGAALGSGALVDMPSAEMPKYTSLYDDSVSVGNTMNQELSQQKANMSEEELSDYNFNNLMAEEARMRELGSLSYGKASPELMAYRRRNILPSLEEVGNQIKLNAASYLDAISSGDMRYTGLPDYEFSKAQGVLDELPSHRDATVRKAVEPMLKEYIDPRDKRSRKDAKNIANMIF